MMLTSRELPPDEWPRLDGTELGPVWRHFDRTKTAVVVVEDGDVIVGTWSFWLVVHAEGLGIAPPYRRRGRVLRMLLRAGQAIIERLGATTFITGAATDEMSAYIVRVGGIALPRAFAIPLAGRFGAITREKEVVCQQ